MQRPLLPEDRIDPAIRDVITSNHRDIIDEVEAAIAANDVVVVGMKQNPFPRRARKALTAAGIAFKYLEYGSYFNTWRRRTALKIWSGWPTFPMIFVKGILVGGAEDVQKIARFRRARASVDRGQGREAGQRVTRRRDPRSSAAPWGMARAGLSGNALVPIQVTRRSG